MNGTVTRADFDDLSMDAKLGVIFETLQSREGLCIDRCKTCQERFKRLERRKWFDKGLATAAGVVGGFFGGLFGKV
jgi:hypothetical protein